jgi:hypothetical protein
MLGIFKRFLSQQSRIEQGIHRMSEQLDKLTADVTRLHDDQATLVALIDALLPLVKPPVAPEDLAAVTATIEGLATDNESLNKTIQAALDAVKTPVTPAA